MQELQPFLAAEFGLVMPGWTLTQATDITPDGRVIVGNGTNPDGNPEGWKVDLSQITDTTWAGSSGNWDDGGVWKYGWFPRLQDDVNLAPATGLVATGPADAKTVHSLTVDATNGTTELRLQNHFTAAAGVTVGNAGKIILAGNQLDAGSGLTIDGGGRVQGYGIVYGPIGGTTGTAGVVSASRSLVLTEPLAVGARQARVLSLGAANLGPDASLAGGAITAPNGLFVAGSSTLRGHGAVNARVAAGIGSLIVADGGDLTIGLAASPAGFFSDGELATGANTVTINDANEAVLGSLTMLGDGVNGGALAAGTAVSGQTRTHFLIEQGKNLVGRGHVAGNVKNHGAVIGDGLLLNERLVFDAGWTVSGIGDFANVLFNGTFAPGLSPGIVAGADLAVGGQLAIELGGPTPGVGLGHHDQVNDAGAFEIVPGATLALQSFGGYLPTAGQQFDILTSAGSIGGRFASVAVDPWFIAQGIGFSVSQSLHALTAEALTVSGDFNRDGAINGGDFLVWQRHVGQVGDDLAGDADGNGAVDSNDLIVWKVQLAAAHGALFSTTVPVPEPRAAILALAAVGLIVLAKGRRRCAGNAGAASVAAVAMVVSACCVGASCARGDLVGHGETVGEAPAGPVIVNHGAIVGTADAPVELGVETHVSGDGYFEHTLVLGTFAPGNSPGISTGANQAFGASAVLQFELGGTQPGFGAGFHDQINDSATLFLFGGPTLSILPHNGFVPVVGQQFKIITWQTGLVGSFGSVAVDPFFASHGIDFTQVITNPGGAGDLTLQAVAAAIPESSAAGCLLAAGAAVWATRRCGRWAFCRRRASDRATLVH